MNHLEAWQKFGKITFNDLPDDVVTIAQQCILDWLGCAIAGRREPLATILLDVFGNRKGNCTIVGSEVKLDAATAALLNGASGHALDYDDTSAAIGCHASAPVLPAALAIAEDIGASGKSLITAFVVGVEIEGRIGSAIGSEHYAKGWHSTSTYGVFGAAAAVAYLLGLNDEQYGMAIGLAASQASGLKANFGTMTKPFHAGHAAERGTISALLAAKGYTSNRDAVAGNQGFFQAAGSGSADLEKLETIKDRWLIRDSLFKYHAACYLTHAAIEGTSQLIKASEEAEMSSLTITVNPGLLDVCGIPTPVTGLEGKFSLRGTAAMTLLGIDTSDSLSFDNETINRQDLQSLLSRITIETDNKLGQMQARVTLVTKNQEASETFFDAGIPAQDLAAQSGRLKQKFTHLVGRKGRVTADQLITKIESLIGIESVDLSQLVE